MMPLAAPAAALADRRAASEQEVAREHLPMLDISVVICTYTEARWADLVDAVESCRRQSLPPREIVVVVDYNQALLNRVRAEIPGVRAVANQGAKGLSGARNTGIDSSSGEFIAFLDDDATADRDWLFHLGRHCADRAVLGVGALVDARWQGVRPAWFPQEFDWVVGCSYRGAPSGTAIVRNLWGGCMCVRREVFNEIGGFSEGLGRVNEKPLGCEDTELCIRAQQRWPGRVFVHEPRARISHRVPDKRGSWRYFLARCYAEGIAKAQVAGRVGAGPALATERRYVCRVLSPALAGAMRDAFLRRRPAGLVRGAAILAGTGAAAAGYVRGGLAHRTSGGE